MRTRCAYIWRYCPHREGGWREGVCRPCEMGWHPIVYTLLSTPAFPRARCARAPDLQRRSTFSPWRRGLTIDATRGKTKKNARPISSSSEELWKVHANLVLFLFAIESSLRSRAQLPHIDVAKNASAITSPRARAISLFSSASGNSERFVSAITMINENGNKSYRSLLCCSIQYRYALSVSFPKARQNNHNFLIYVVSTRCNFSVILSIFRMHFLTYVSHARADKYIKCYTY